MFLLTLTLRCFRLHTLRLLLLERMLQYLGEVGEVGGERTVPFMQVLLMLTSDMDSEEDRDRAILDTFLTSLIQQLDLTGKVLYTCRAIAVMLKIL